MALIKSIHLLDLQQNQLQILEKRAELHRRHSSIEFKVLAVKDGIITIRIIQEKSFTGNYFNTKRLAEIGKELFDGIFDGRQIHCRPVPYSPSPVDVVTAEWIQRQFEQTGVKIKQAGHDLGVDPNTISALKAGKKPLSGITKAAFYYYFSQLLRKPENNA